MMINTVNTQFSFVKFWFTDQVSKALKDNVDLTIIWVALIKMRYIDPRYSKYVKGYSSLSVAGKFGDKYEKKKLMDAATKTGIDDAKTVSKRVVQKIAEARGDLIGNKITDKITSLGKPKEKTKKVKEIYILPEKKATNY